MTREAILANALFNTGGEIDGLKFGPLSPPVLTILKRRRNTLFGDNAREQDHHEALGEILFVLSRTKEERASLFRIPDAEWDTEVGAFVAGLEDQTLGKFGAEYLQPAMMELQAAAVESEGAGKVTAYPCDLAAIVEAAGRVGLHDLARTLNADDILWDISAAAIMQLFMAHGVASGGRFRWCWWPDPSPEIEAEFERLAALTEQEALTEFDHAYRD